MAEKPNLFHVTDSEFKDKVLGSDKLVVVDFWAEWCVPCKMIAPIIEQLADEYPDVLFAKMDVDANPETATEYGIMSIPTVGFFKNGQLVDQIVGAVPKKFFVDMIEKHK